MKPDERQEFGEDGEDLLRMLQEELAESDREVMALALDLERRLELRHTAMLDAQAEFSRTSSELLRMAMQLEDRVNERNQEVVALRDDLERRVAERTARALVTSRAKVAFLANLSHEIRTPLSAILGFAQLLARGPELGSRQRDFVDNINRAGEHLLGIVNSSLELLKIETGHARAAQGAVHLEQMLRDLDRTYRPLALAKGLEWRQEAGGAPEHFRADPTRLREVLENLLGNAFKFTDRGHVILRVRAVGKQPEPVRLVFEVEDSGPGIAAGERDRLFEPFEQGSAGVCKGGTGLGLAICRQYARLMGGEVRLHGAEGTGSRFRLTLPLETCEPSRDREAPARFRVANLEQGQEPVRVLVVDDVPAGRQVLLELLREAGFQVRAAEGGAEGLELFETWRPQAVLLDLRMPHMDGFEVLRRLRGTRDGLHTVVIAVTASAFGEDREQVLAAGADDFIAKPFADAELFEKLRAHLGLAYQYHEEGPARPQPPPAPADLLELPADLRDALREALLEADLERIAEAIAGIRGRDPAVAERLDASLRNFEYQDLLDLLEGASPP